ncbi:MAG TPA: 4Fe-4S dicluster domain-containing protein [Nitrospiraceae bacterium]|jgi:sulfhydrogenase subunit beta (sulfur reductase)|nr:4Fe-4S dicluster domain-containing protein [Nitrospiraceae bacterium]
MTDTTGPHGPPGPSSPRPRFLPLSLFQRLIDTLRNKGYRVMGPTVRDGALVWDEIRHVADLPKGWRETQEPGRYRLEQSGSERLFDVVHGPESLKRFAFAAREPLVTIERKAGGLLASSTFPKRELVAILGARACDLAGLAVQDRIFLQGSVADPYYQARRDCLFLVAVNCTRAASICFCASMDTGPQARGGYDVALTELDEGFVAQAGTPAGLEVLEELAPALATPVQVSAVQEGLDACARSQPRRLDASRLPQALYEAHEHARWDEVAQRCLACTNCTMVCPTCFCHSVTDLPDLDRRTSTRVRLWDSCFTPDHGYIHGKNVRPTIKDRYRMWLTHKLASWIDQFGVSGCVGCGRCITWCPVGIDLTEELASLISRDGPVIRLADSPAGDTMRNDG